MVKNIIVFTDGSSTVYKDQNNMKYGGIGVYFEENNKYNVSKSLKGSNITNQRAELEACIIAIKNTIEMMSKSRELWNLTIYSDSVYSIKCATEWAKKWILYGWKKKSGNTYTKPCNLDLIKKLYKLSCMYPITYIHVKSHKPEPKNDPTKWRLWFGNKQADSLATNAMFKCRTKK